MLKLYILAGLLTAELLILIAKHDKEPITRDNIGLLLFSMVLPPVALAAMLGVAISMSGILDNFFEKVASGLEKVADILIQER